MTSRLTTKPTLGEQTAYYDSQDDRITKLRILCSGFLPAAGRRPL